MASLCGPSSEPPMHRAIALTVLPTALAATAVAGDEISRHTPSQKVECEAVASTLEALPRGDGDGKVTDDEVGPDGWRLSRFGTSVVTVAYRLDRNDTPEDPTDDFYAVTAGRSGTGANEKIVNAYPAELDREQSPVRGLRDRPERFWYSAANLEVPKRTLPDALTFEGEEAKLVLTGTRTTRPRAFRFPGRGIGRVAVTLRDPDGDGVYTGCGKSPVLNAHALRVGTKKKGELLQRAFVKVHAAVNDAGRVEFLEHTEISVFKTK